MSRKTGSDSRTGSAPPRKRESEPLALEFPRPVDTDPEDVQVALSAASALWDGGDGTEALKWLRRAASAASDHDADVRSLELFKHAADLASELDARSSGAKPDAGRVSSAPPSSGSALSVSGSTPGPSSTAANALKVAAGEPAADKPAEASRRGPRLGQSIVPAVPPEPLVMETPLRLRRREEESDEDTVIRPETMLRRALLAIDPEYANRTDYSSRDMAERRRRGSSAASSSHPDSRRARSSLLSDTGIAPRRSSALALGSTGAEMEQADGEATRKQRSRPELQGESDEGETGTTWSIPGSLPALRVAVLPIPEERDVRLLFVPPGVAPPPGVALATLLPMTEEDAELLAEIYADTDAKL